VAPVLRLSPILVALAAALAVSGPAPALAGIGTGAGACPQLLPARLATTGGARELITVVAPGPSSSSGTLSTWTLTAGCWRRSGGPWPAWLGWAGVSKRHREGDGTTPEGSFGIGPVIYGNAPDPGVRYAYRRLACGDWWDEDPASPEYNHFVELGCGQRPAFGGGSEALWRSPVAYAYFALIDYNTGPIVPGAGSAIFLHASIDAPTDGCVALASGELVEVLRWLAPASAPRIVIGTSADIGAY
jgi:L,D-peptidoglycan transpeptidase YkuD (ErfK/YbiS/YcfS/YnhG family)